MSALSMMAKTLHSDSRQLFLCQKICIISLQNKASICPKPLEWLVIQIILRLERLEVLWES